MRYKIHILLALSLGVLSLSAHSHDSGEHYDFYNGDPETSFEELGINQEIQAFACKKPTAAQTSQVVLGNEKAADFYQACLAETDNSTWCQEVMRPNPASVSTFRCTYGNDLPHQLIHPDENSWVYAIQGVRLVQGLQDLGIKVCQIYNWWRPEPYNVNVGGAAGRHPFATSIDVKFCSRNDMEKAFTQLCKWRAQGQLRAIGYYDSYSLHFGVGDKTANTWGKVCPKSI